MTGRGVFDPLRRTAERPGEESGSVVGATVGATIPQVEPTQRTPGFPIGPGGVVGDDTTEPPPPEQQAAHAQDLERHQRWGREAGVLARRSRRGPTLPAMPDDDDDAPPFPIGPGGVVARFSATQRAAHATGVPEPYIRALVGHESGGDEEARAPTSSATGLGQFTDPTWLATMRRYGPDFGFGTGELADLSDAEILELRTNPLWSTLMTAEYARENVTELRRALGRRRVNEGEAYLAHFLGPHEAAGLINAAQVDARSEHRSRPASSVVSRRAVESNPHVFYAGGNFEWRIHPQTGRRYQHYMGGGRERTTGEVVALQTRNFRQTEFIEGDHQGRAAVRARADALAQEEIESQARHAAIERGVAPSDDTSYVRSMFRLIYGDRNPRKSPPR